MRNRVEWNEDKDGGEVARGGRDSSGRWDRVYCWGEAGEQAAGVFDGWCGMLGGSVGMSPEDRNGFGWIPGAVACFVGTCLGVGMVSGSTIVK